MFLGNEAESRALEDLADASIERVVAVNEAFDASALADVCDWKRMPSHRVCEAAPCSLNRTNVVAKQVAPSSVARTKAVDSWTPTNAVVAAVTGDNEANNCAFIALCA